MNIYNKEEEGQPVSEDNMGNKSKADLLGLVAAEEGKCAKSGGRKTRGEGTFLAFRKMTWKKRARGGLNASPNQQQQNVSLGPCKADVLGLSGAKGSTKKKGKWQEVDSHDDTNNTAAAGS